ncbi:hypothetical protein [Phaeodactylibacter xiamenensis]
MRHNRKAVWKGVPNGFSNVPKTGAKEYWQWGNPDNYQDQLLW